jgi:AcrR family transcriptional regulator
MRKGEATREAIVGEALRQAVAVGLEGLSLGPLADRLKLSKSGLFAHFKSKEALQLAVVREAVDRFARTVAAPAFQAPPGRPRLEALIGRYLDWIKGGKAMGGCPFVTMVVEFDDRPGPVRDLLVERQKAWRGTLRQILEQGVERKHFRRDIDPAQIAFEIIGVALSYQHAAKLLAQPDARSRADRALRRLLDGCAPRGE